MAPPFTAVIVTPILRFICGGGEAVGSGTKYQFVSFVVKPNKVPSEWEEGTFGIYWSN